MGSAVRLSYSYDVLKNVDGRPVILDVHDGDTVRLGLNVGGDAAIHPALRVKGLYCPELGQDGGLMAWLFTAAVLNKANDITVTIHSRSFARWVAYIVVDGIDLARTVIAAGHGTATP